MAGEGRAARGELGILGGEEVHREIQAGNTQRHRHQNSRSLQYTVTSQLWPAPRKEESMDGAARDRRKERGLTSPMKVG